MPNYKNESFNWEEFNKKDVLGEEFWDQMSSVIPKRGPNVDIYYTEHEYVVIIEAPGLISKDNIQIQKKGNQLVLSGEIPWIYPVLKNNLIRKERFLGTFKRIINLPSDVIADSYLKAQYKNGIILIQIPKVKTEDIRDIPLEF